MPVTLQKRIWVEGRTNLSHLGKITAIFFLIFNTHNLNMYNCCYTLHNSYVVEQEQGLITIINTGSRLYIKIRSILLSPVSKISHTFLNICSHPGIYRKLLCMILIPNPWLFGLSDKRSKPPKVMVHLKSDERPWLN